MFVLWRRGAPSTHRRATLGELLGTRAARLKGGDELCDDAGCAVFQYVVPDGKPPSAGAWVYLPREEAA